MATPVALPPQFGRYRIVRSPGSGGMGSVHLAEDTLLSRQVAHKVPHITADDNPQVLGKIMVDPFVGLGSGAGLSGTFSLVVHLIPFFVIGWATTSAWYLWAVGKSVKDRGFSGRGFLLGIVIPSALVGMDLISCLVSLLMKNARSPTPFMILMVFHMIIVLGVFGWQVWVLRGTRSSIKP
jgi:hypothetical protein